MCVLTEFLAFFYVTNIINKINKIVKCFLTNIVFIREQLTANIRVVWLPRTKNREGTSFSTFFWRLTIIQKVAGWRNASPGVKPYPGEEGAG